MARRRMLDGKIWDDPKTRKLSLEARLLFIFLITEADDEGRLWDSPQEWVLRVFPGKEVDADRLIKELRRQRLVAGYKAEGRAAVFLPGWFSNQHLSHPIPSMIVPPPSKVLAKHRRYARELYALYSHQSQHNRSEASRRKYQQLIKVLANRLDGNGRTPSGHSLDVVRPE